MVTMDRLTSCPCCGVVVRIVSHNSTWSGVTHNCSGRVVVNSEPRMAKSDTKPVNDFISRKIKKSGELWKSRK